MTVFLDWLKGRRVLPRWKLGLLVLIGVWVGFLIALGDYFLAMFLGALMVWEVTQRASD